MYWYNRQWDDFYLRLIVHIGQYYSKYYDAQIKIISLSLPYLKNIFIPMHIQAHKCMYMCVHVANSTPHGNAV